VVFSTTLTAVQGIIAIGGAALATQAASLGLIDEYQALRYRMAQ
jgi:hypothetical protein